MVTVWVKLPHPLEWRHTEQHGVSSHRHLDCLLSFVQPFFQHINENTKARWHWPLWGNPPLIGGFSSQRASNAENVSISWRHPVFLARDMWPSDTIWRHRSSSSLDQARACCLFGNKSPPDPMLSYCRVDRRNFNDILIKENTGA